MQPPEPHLESCARRAEERHAAANHASVAASVAATGLHPLQPEAERPLATLQPAGVNTEHAIALSGAQQGQSTWRRQQQQQFEEQQAGARLHPPAHCAAQSEWGRSTSREDAAPPSLTPEQIRAQVEAARGPQARRARGGHARRPAIPPAPRRAARRRGTRAMVTF